MKLHVSELALQDLEAIADYTVSEWSELRWQKYRTKLEATLAALRSGRDPGRPFHLPGRTLRRVLVGKHHIYFERNSDLVFISRVLHGAMNVYLLEFPEPPSSATNE